MNHDFFQAGQIGSYVGVPMIKSPMLDKNSIFVASDPAPDRVAPLIFMGWLAMAKFTVRMDAREQVAAFAARYGL